MSWAAYNQKLVKPVNQYLVSSCVTGWPMAGEPLGPRSEQHERLRAARLAAGYASTSDAARAMGLAVSTYTNHENGTAGLSRSGDRYARFFGVNYEWLMTGKGQMKDAPAAPLRFILPVVGVIGAGGAIDTAWEQTAEPLHEIEIPINLGDDVIGFEIRGESMWPKFDPHDVIVVHRHGEVIDSLLGFEAAVRLADGGRYFKRIIRSGTPGLYDLESYNAPPMRGVRVEWASGLVATVPASRWKKRNGQAVKEAVRKAQKAATRAS